MVTAPNLVSLQRSLEQAVDLVSERCSQNVVAILGAAVRKGPGTPTHTAHEFRVLGGVEIKISPRFAGSR
ncbi:MAG: hypothetical protein ABIJ09_00390 [Pseudomonadota bacterium]